MADDSMKKNKAAERTNLQKSFKIPLQLLNDAGEPCNQWLLQVSTEARRVWLRDFLNNVIGEENIAIEQLGNDFCLLRGNQALTSGQLLSTVFPRWLSPLEHQWPTKPASDGFVEKAAQGLSRKFGAHWESLEILSTTPELKRIAVGLKGRLLQLREIEDDSTPRSGVLTALIDQKGLYAGMSRSRLNMGTALPGGLGFLSKSEKPSSELPSRAGGKIREVLALLEELKVNKTHFHNWLELGAAPGGMTQCLLDWGANVTAVDLADMSPSVLKNKGLRHLRINALQLTEASEFDAILSDMNGPYENAARIVANLGFTLRQNGFIVFTLKLPKLADAKKALDEVTQYFLAQSLEVLAAKHLFHNRQEITIFARRI